MSLSFSLPEVLYISQWILCSFAHGQCASVKIMYLRLWTTHLLSVELDFVPKVCIYLLGIKTHCPRRSYFCPWKLSLSVFGDHLSLFPHLVVENFFIYMNVTRK